MSLFTRLHQPPDTDGATTKEDHEPSAPPEGGARDGGMDNVLWWTVTVLAAALVFVALMLPGNVAYFEAKSFLRIPAEPILLAALLLVLPERPRRVVAVLSGVGLALVLILKLLDIGFNQFLGRGFNVVLDWGLLDDAESYLQDTAGGAGALAAVIGIVVLVLALLVVMPLAVVRLVGLMHRDRHTASRATIVAGTVWITCSALGLHLIGTTPLATSNTIGLLQDRVARVKATLKDEAAFAKEVDRDAFADVPPDRLLTGLRGKDVIFAFIESYGRAALQDPAIAPGVDATLDAATDDLREAGFSAKSGWLTSATYGGSSWLGHSTFLSGLWIDNQDRYRTVTAGERLTLPGAFHRTGAWRTVGVVPGVQYNWPEGRFYGLDKVYDSRDLGYQGPKFSWSTMPDQYALTAFQRLEHGKERDKPLMSQIILTSSHQPWAPLPEMIDWDRVGDGSVYQAIEKAGKNPADVFSDGTRAKKEYGRSVQYSVRSLTEFVERYGDKDTVVVFLGDHQPMARVSGNGASHDVPITIVAHDEKVLDRISDWGWSDGLKPTDDAPVWRMDRFRNRFLTAYGPQNAATATPSASPANP
ncbi:sulfatase-like hydrolase/transferase [Streptomyces bluensis]|uniref:Sulfatase-like hydrolase/transferase n=1 Tax=Streptomyces bluensis TaxID=33897 RepID=A0ABW6UCN7_9ACTN